MFLPRFEEMVPKADLFKVYTTPYGIYSSHTTTATTFVLPKQQQPTLGYELLLAFRCGTPRSLKTPWVHQGVVGSLGTQRTSNSTLRLVPWQLHKAQLWLTARIPCWQQINNYPIRPTEWGDPPNQCAWTTRGMQIAVEQKELTRMSSPPPPPAWLASCKLEWCHRRSATDN